MLSASGLIARQAVASHRGENCEKLTHERQRVRYRMQDDSGVGKSKASRRGEELPHERWHKAVHAKLNVPMEPLA